MLKIYFKFKAQYLKTAMEYPFNFWMLVVAGVIMRTLLMGVAFVLFRNVPDIAGWREGEVYLIMSFMFISEGLCNIFFEGIWRIPALVFNGEFDVMLSRPISPLYQVLSYDIGLHGIGNVTMGVISLILAVGTLDVSPLLALILCPLFILTGAILRMSAYLIGACNVFWLKTGGQTNIPYVLTSVGEYAKYPVNIYPLWVRSILFTILPFAFIGYVPALILKGENPVLYGVLLVVTAVLYFLLARFIFYRGIRRYESMGM